MLMVVCMTTIPFALVVAVPVVLTPLLKRVRTRFGTGKPAASL